MNAWEKWKKRPQIVWLRKALFQVHLWAGIGLGIYILIMSVSGSAVVFRRELSRSLSREPRVAVGPAARMTEDQLRQIAVRALPDYQVTRIYLRKNPDQAAEIWLERGAATSQHLFNPYTGADLGDSLRWGFRFLLWLVDLHDNLLAGQTGRRINATGGIFTVLLALTGVVIWWPGVDSWRRSLSFNWKANPKGFNWTLHSALGFWTFAFFFMWALTGIYLSIPVTFSTAVDYLEPPKEGSRSLRFGDQVMSWFAQAHFGRFAGIGTKILWTVMGLVPAVLFVTGSLMWWKRVLKPWLSRKEIASSRLKRVAATRSGNSIQARQ